MEEKRKKVTTVKRTPPCSTTEPAVLLQLMICAALLLLLLLLPTAVLRIAHARTRECMKCFCQLIIIKKSRQKTASTFFFQSPPKVMPANPFAALGVDSDEEAGPPVPPAAPKSTLKMPPAYVPLMTPPEPLTPSRSSGKQRGHKKDGGGERSSAAAASSPAPASPASSSPATPAAAAAEPVDVASPAVAPAAPPEPQQKRLYILRGLPGR